MEALGRRVPAVGQARVAVAAVAVATDLLAQRLPAYPGLSRVGMVGMVVVVDQVRPPTVVPAVAVAPVSS